MKPIKTSLPITGYWDTRQGGRPENQDSCGFIDTELGFIALVCDGMGGGPAGQLASSIAVQKIVEYIVNAPQDITRMEALKNAIEYAHKAIIEKGKENPKFQGMGTTVTALLINKQSAIVAHVGDSRIYQFRRGRKIFRSADHSMVAELVRNGTLTEEQARLSSQSNIITRALGGQAEQLAEAYELPYEKGDRFMLCTDGIWGMLPEKELIRKTAKTASLSGAVDATVIEVDEIGRKNGNSHDNLTMALIETKQDSILKEKMSKRTILILGTMAAILLISLIANALLASKLLGDNSQNQEIELLNHQIEQKDKQIADLQGQVQKLSHDVANSKQQAADAKLDAANQKEAAAQKAKEEAQKAKEEAQQAKEEAKNAAEQAKNSAEKAQKAVSEALKIRQTIIASLTKASTLKEGKERQNIRNNAISSLKQLIAKDAKNKAVYSEVIEKLGNKIATSNSDQAKGHYNALISKLKNIK